MMMPTAETALQLIAKAGRDQRVKYKVTPEPECLFPADSIGGQLVALSDLFRALGTQDGITLKTMLASIRMDADGSIEFELVIMQLTTEKEQNPCPPNQSP